jgi:glycosyltransferase involved in cell wall biosynthesis
MVCYLINQNLNLKRDKSRNKGKKERMKHYKPTVLLMTNYPGFVGGAELQIYALARGIDKKKFRVLLVALYDGNFTSWQIPGVETYKLRRRGKYDFFPIFRIMKILVQNRVDIIQPFLTPSTLFGLLPSFIVRTPVRVVTERCGMRTAQRLGYKILCFLEDLLGHSSKMAVANSIAGQKMLLNRGYKSEKTCVIYNGLEMSRLEAEPELIAKIQAETGLNPDEPVVGISAWVIPAKDHFTFLKSASIVLKQKPGVRFAILGDGILVPDLKALAKELNISEQVVFLGAQAQVGNYLHFFDILVSSSIDHEGCSNSIMEAMVLGKAVVATDVGGNRELVIPGENGLLVPPQDPEAMAQAVLSLLNNPELSRQMGEKGRARILSEFSLEQMVTHYQDLWLNLLEKKSPGGETSNA